MEVLFGYLHLSQQKERMRELFLLAYPDEQEPCGIPAAINDTNKERNPLQ